MDIVQLGVIKTKVGVFNELALASDVLLGDGTVVVGMVVIVVGIVVVFEVSTIKDTNTCTSLPTESLPYPCKMYVPSDSERGSFVIHDWLLPSNPALWYQ